MQQKVLPGLVESRVAPDRFVDVALPLPLMQAMTYRVPAGWPDVPRGSRAEAPFGKRRVMGVVVKTDTRPKDGVSVKDLTAVFDEEPLVTERLLELALWVADYYIGPIGQATRLVAPPGGVRASKRVVRLKDPTSPASLVAASSDPVLQALREAGGRMSVAALAARLDKDITARLLKLDEKGLVEFEAELATTDFQRVQVATAQAGLDSAELKGRALEVATLLKESGGVLAVRDLVGEVPSRRQALKSLEKKGLVTLGLEVAERRPDPSSQRALRPTPLEERILTPEQSEADTKVAVALGESKFVPILLEGVTGSGKTEIYLRAVQKALELGKTALLLVPEIGLTSTLVRASRERFGDAVSVLHSDMAEGVRHDEWWRARRGEARVVVGARSAVFAPLPNLGLIVVDEEHDSAYKQEDAPRYHGRDVAVYRARLEKAVILLGSATPSMESRLNAIKERYAWLRLRSRVGPMGLARVHIIDRKKQKVPTAILTAPLVEAIAERLSRKEQTVLLLNRRGYATSLVCRECGASAQCPHCSVAFVLHRRGEQAQCHYCGLIKITPTRCSMCRGDYLRLQGYGTQRVAEVLLSTFPEAIVDRIDRDIAARRGAVEGVLHKFEKHETDILIGTQMIAKGHDFPKVTLVGVIDADVGLGLPDFRSAERTFALLTQVAGRAGRADLPGEVLLQTHNPKHYAIEYAQNQDYDAFFDREMEFRRTMGYPPHDAMVNILFRGRVEDEVAKSARNIARRLKVTLHEGVLGPSPSPLSKVRDEFRYQVVVRGKRGVIRESVHEVLIAEFGPMRFPGVAVDVDPLSLM
ncbi:MAG TPA: primosomal protein N' [Vicinamibacteria bacterium]|nr:primosomal protein N' [Vicinamibacteria bacterium]